MDGTDRWAKRGGALLVVAALLVGIAIAADGAVARGVNGVGGLLWLAAAALLLWSLRGTEGRVRGAVVLVLVVTMLAIVVRPSDLLAAVLGFSIGGAIVAFAGRPAPLRWALLMSAAWLPAHLLLAVSRSVWNGGTTIRTDPPPTAALVPLTMVLAAAGGGALVGWWRTERRRADAAATEDPASRGPGETVTASRS